MLRSGLVCLLLCCLGGCQPPEGASSSGPSPRGDGARLRIAVIPKGTTHVFWKSVHAGAEQAAREHGNVEILWKGPLLENDREGQINVVQDFVTARVDGICLAPLDSQALVPYVRDAKDRGIPTVIFDSGLDDHRSIVSYVATDNYEGGVLAARRLAEVLDGKGSVILLRYNPGSESTEQRERGFLEALGRDYPGITVISSDQYSGTTPESSLEKSQQLLITFGERLDGAFAVCEPNSEGMLGALEDKQLAGKVKFIAFDPSPRLIKAMVDGKVHGIVLQDPVKMGYLAVKTMVAHLAGQEVERRVNTGEYVATRDNMDQPAIHALLHPVQFGARDRPE